MRLHSEPCIIVLGMHRSGTSVLAGCLQALGVSLGKNLMPQDSFNEFGMFENNDIHTLHERLFHSLGRTWKMVGGLPAGWLDSKPATLAARHLEAILDKQFVGKVFWAIKDPRICRFLPLWRKVLETKGISPAFVLMTRHPDEVAASLKKRDGLDLTTGRLLWLVHYRDALSSLAGTPHVIVTYDQLLADPLSTLHNITTYFGLTYPKAGSAASKSILDFVQPCLRHHHFRADSNGASAPYTWLYASLQQRQLTSWVTIKNQKGVVPIPGMDTLPPVHPFAQITPGKDLSAAHGAVIMSDILSTLGQYEQRENDDRLRRERAFLATTGDVLFLQVYFPCPHPDTYIEDFSQRFLLIPDRWNEISLDIPAPEVLKTSRLRLDPLNKQGQIIFSCLRLTNAATEDVLWEAKTVQDFQACASNEQILFLANASEPCLVCMGTDPIFYLPVLPDLPNVPTRLLIWVKPSHDTIAIKSSLEATTRELAMVASSLRQAEDNLKWERASSAVCKATFEQEKANLTGQLNTIRSRCEDLVASLQEAEAKRGQLQNEMRDLLAMHQSQENALEAEREATRVQTRRAETAEAALETARGNSDGQGQQLRELRDQLDMENRKFEAVRQAAAQEQHKLRQTETMVETLRARLLSLMGQLQDVELGREHLIDLVQEKAAALLLRIGSNKLQIALQFYRDFAGSSRKMSRARKEFKDFQASQIVRIEQAGALDTAYYDEHNPDVAAEHFPLVEHYVRHGWRECRAPKANFDNALYLLDHPDLIDSGLCPLAHALDAPETDREQTTSLATAIELRSAPGSFEAALVRQSGLFDAAYYAGTHAYLADSSPDALLRHYLAYGWKEGSRPSAWLDLSRSPLGVGESGPDSLCPLVRMALLETGPQTQALPAPSEPRALAGPTACPSPAPQSVPETEATPESDYDRAMRLIVEQRLFDADFYRQQYEDLHSLSGPGALLRHYMEYGWKEGRRASPEFDTAYYVAKYPFVAESGINPLVHYALYGRPEGFSGAMRTDDPAPLLAALQPAGQAGTGTWTPPDIIVPVYVRDEAGLGLLDRLLASLDAGTPEPCRFVILDDASPYPGVGERLNAFRDAHPGCVAERNPQNLGFVCTVNKAFTLASGDVVIVNMDVEVPQGWLTRIIAPLRRTDIRVASVTPMTNSGTIASFPVFCQDNAGLPLDMGLAAVDAVFSRYDPSVTIEIPTGVGFCMAMCRAALEEVGDFDAQSFGLGYGEENDWCRRALQKGFVNLLLPGCFVWHKHGGSFAPDQKQALCSANGSRLSEKHPDYNREVARFVERDPGNVFRFHAAVHLAVVHSNQPTFLIVDHSLGGGASVYSQKRLDTMCQQRPALLLFYDVANNCYVIELRYRDLEGSVRLVSDSQVFALLPLLGVKEFLFNNFVSWPTPLSMLERFGALAAQTDTRSEFVFHEYYSLCPNCFLVGSSGVYCHLEGDSKTCERCLRDTNAPVVDIGQWRRAWADFLNKIDVLVCFSVSSASLIRSCFGDNIGDRLLVRPHTFSFLPRKPIIVIQDSLRVGVVGHITQHKGSRVIKNLVEAMDRRGLGSLCVLGAYVGERIDSERFSWAGSYSNHEELVQLVERSGANTFLFPSVWPETFSFVTSELLEMDLPVTCFDIGAPAERVSVASKGQVLPLDSSPDTLLDALLRSWERFGRHEPDCVRLTRAADPAALTSAVLAASPAAGRPLRVLMSSGLHDSASRLYRLTNQAEQLEHNGWSPRIATPAELKAVSPDDFDLLYLHRMPWGGPVSLLVEAAVRQHKPVVADLDDLLFFSSLGSRQFYFLEGADATWRNEYKQTVAGVEALLRTCHALVASTPAIAGAGLALGKPAFVQRNSLSRDQLDLASRVREHTPFPQEPVIIFAAGSNTHDQDLALIEPVLARIFDEVPAARLIVLGHLRKKNELLNNFSSRVERVAYLHDAKAYFELMARATVALAPLHTINTFSEAKSAVKFLEFGALGVPLIASPSAEYSRHIRHGVSGWLARDTREWYEALRTALTPGTAAATGAAAQKDVRVWCDVQTNADRLCGFLFGLAVRVAAGEGFGPAGPTVARGVGFGHDDPTRRAAPPEES